MKSINDYKKLIAIARTEKIQIVSSIVIIGFVLAVFYNYFMGSYLEYGYPLNTFLVNPEDKFADFLKPLNCGKTLSPYLRRGVENTCMPISVVYYPFGELFFYPFSKIPGKSLWIFLGIFLIGWFVFIVKNFAQNEKSANLRDLFIISLISYPFLFTLDRANLESYVFLLVAGFCYFYNSANKYISLLACISLSLAIAIKPFPAFFLLLLVKEKKWKNILFIIASSIIVNIASALYLKDGIWANFLGVINSQKEFISDYVVGNMGWYYGHSILGLLKCIFSAILYFCASIGLLKKADIIMIVHNWPRELFTVSSIISVIIILFVTWYILFKEKEFWKIVALIVFIMLLTPLASADYRLLYIFLPMAFFVNSLQKTKYDSFYTVLFGLLLVPKSYMFHTTKESLVLLGVLVEPLLMIFFAYLIIKDGLKSKSEKINVYENLN